jgi:tetratricopeptide (TPR) repeat protein
MQYRDTARDVRAIGGELGVGYVLEGSVRRGEHRVRVTAHLVATADGMHLWADTYEQPVADVLEIQSAIAERVGDSLSIHLFSEQTTAHAQAAQTSPEARDEFLKGRHLCHMRTAEGFRSAIRHFERAIELDGRFAPAHAGLAETYAILGFWGYGVLPPRAAYPPARASAEQAVRLDPSLAQAHATLGFVQYAYDWDWAGSERSLRRALELDPSYATGHQRYASLLALQRRLPEALEEIDRALALDPRSLLVNLTMAWLHYFARDDEAAREHCRRTLELKPDFPTTHLLLAAVHSLAGRAEEALAEHEAFDRLGGPPSVGLMERACHFARVGESARAGHYLADLRRRHAAGQAFSWQLAVVHAALAEPDAAFAALEKALEERSDVMAFLKIEPHWDPLRGDARFTRLLERVGLA